MSVQKLDNFLENWDGKSADYLASGFAQYKDDNNFRKQLLKRLLPEPKIPKNKSAAASWLIKHDLENGAEYSSWECESIIKALGLHQDWQTRLHLLQSLPYLTLRKASRGSLESTLRDGIIHSNKLVRAWSYNGLALLADCHEDLRNECSQLIQLANKDECASVKARIRNIKKSHAWLS